MITHRLTRLFPLWAIIFSVAAYCVPNMFTGYKAAIVPLLGIVMFGMGMTLEFEEFADTFRHGGRIVLGVVLQYTVMPFAAWVLARLLGLSNESAAGLILVGCCPGGTASNVLCYLAGGDVALSISLTAISTFLAFIATPFLTLLYAGQRVPVPVGSMILSIVFLVICPVVLGMGINAVMGRRLAKVKTAAPLISMTAIVFIIAIIVALNRQTIATSGIMVMAAVAVHNIIGLAGGYGISRLFGFSQRHARTIAIEVGMQNSGLGVALAMKYFSAAAALPGALFSIWHNLSGSVLAWLWQRNNGD